MGSYTKLKTLLSEKGSFVLICHVQPDGDAVGALLAMRKVLVGQGKTVKMVSKDPVPKIFSFLDGISEIESNLPEKTDAVILLDNGDFRRTGFMAELRKLKEQKIPIINIDHHPKNDLWKFVSVNHVSDEASSTCELLYEIFTDVNFTIDSECATDLLTGIFYDTGGFRHPNTSKKVLDIVSDLLKRGAKLKKISESINGTRSISLFRLWGIALDRLRLNKKYGISVSVLTAKDLEETNSSEDEISGLVNLLNSTPESKAALLLYEGKDGKIRGSLRTDRDDVDVAKLAEVLGGGGHRKASGFTIDGKIVLKGENWKII